MKLDVGVDVGSVSINCLVIDENQRVVYEAPYVRHFGLVQEETWLVLEKVAEVFDPRCIRSIAFTGVHGRSLAKMTGAYFEVETISQVIGAVRIVPSVSTIISIGGQDAALFQISHNDGQWHLDNFTMNGPCASGTGSFIDQQAERLVSSIYGPDFHYDQHKVQKTLDDFISLGLTSDNPAPVACRCTVFTKSDMIHLQNKGETLANIVAGLHYGNAANYVSTLVGNRELARPMIFIGGVASNAMQVLSFKRYYSGLAVPRYHASLGALGVALQAQKIGWKNSFDLSRPDKNSSREYTDFPRADRLKLKLTHFDEDNSLPVWSSEKEERRDAYLGVDIGSTTTKYALISSTGDVLHKCYVQTQGKPIEVTQNLLKVLRNAVDDGARLLGVATTGSGRNVVGEFLEADLIIDEITAHARGAVEVDATIDTIFEIGGQDSKYISINDTHPLDFDMNKVCAAGTGSFLHELANKMKINIVGQFQEIALAAKNPVYLAERCTVFMESDIVSYLQKGARAEDLIAGLCYAIVHNYLNRVVGKRRIGKRIMFLGGPSLNQGIVAAFEKVLGRALIVPKHREVLGAYGAAMALSESCKRGQIKVRERDFGSMANMEVKYSETVCRANKKCHNECKLKVYNFGGRKEIWGGDCGRHEIKQHAGPSRTNLFEERQKLFEELLEGRAVVPREKEHALHSKAGEQSVGIPMALHSLEWGIFWVHVFSELGYQVILSPPTDQKIAMSGVESMTSETCFPVKVFHGHTHYLLDRAKYLFLPNVINMPTPVSREVGLFCPFIESSQYMVKAALGISESRIISPTLYLKEGPEEIIESFRSSFTVGLRPTYKRLARVVHQAWEKQVAFGERLKRRGEDLLRKMPANEPVWIITGRPYNLYDERCNLKLGKQLAKLGITAVPMDFMDLESEDLADFSKMYWGLGSRILRAAKLIARTSNFHGVHLSNFSCGADSFIEHFYRHILKEKPSLILEMDEHSAAAGLMTRLEAYQNVVKNVHMVEEAVIGG